MKFHKFLLAFLVLLLSACSTQTTPVATRTPEPIIAPTPQTYKVTFLAFHDYNGNGKQDEGEPVLEGILNKTTGGECTTGTDGKCEIAGIPAGNINIALSDNRKVEEFEKMRYVLPSVSEVKTIDQGLSIYVVSNIEVNEPLGQGFLTKPFSPKIKYKIKNFLDLDKNPCPSGSNPHYCDNARDWNNGKQTYDDHTGIDYNTIKGTPILAVAPGVITHVGVAELSGNWGNYLEITHYLDFRTYYGHMSLIEVKEGDIVERGQEIGKVGSSGASSEPHLHLEMKLNNNFIDPYKDVLSSSSINYWTKLNDPISPY